MHDFIDKYSGMKSPVHMINAAVKIVTILFMIVFIVTVPVGRSYEYLLYFLFITVILIAAKIPLRYVLLRSLIILPFAVLTAIFLPFHTAGETVYSASIGSLEINVTREGLMLLVDVAIKSWLAAVSIILLSATTKFSELLFGFRRLGFPRILILLLSFMYRYMFIIVDEAEKMTRARDSRNSGRKKFWRLFRVTANIVGLLFIRSYERGERVYSAMMARGFNGDVVIASNKRIRVFDLLGALFLIVIITAERFVL